MCCADAFDAMHASDPNADADAFGAQGEEPKLRDLIFSMSFDLKVTRMPAQPLDPPIRNSSLHFGAMIFHFSITPHFCIYIKGKYFNEFFFLLHFDFPWTFLNVVFFF